MNTVTSIALPVSDPTTEQARDFARVLCHRMGLNRAEWLALVNSMMVWARARDERGVLWSRHTQGQMSAVHGWEGPKPVEIQGALAVNMMIRTAVWISALRGKVAKRGDCVAFQCYGRTLFGRVIRKNTDGTLRIALEDGQIGFGKFTGGVYAGRTIVSFDADECAVLAR